MFYYQFFQFAIKGDDNEDKDYWKNKIRSFGHLSMLKQVYFYEYGKPVNEKIHMTISQSLYEKTLEYVAEKELKSKEFLKSTTAIHKNYKRRANEIIKSNYEKSNKSAQKNIGEIAQLEEKIEDLLKIVKKLESELLNKNKL